jgi:hypothetical protein
MPKSKTADQVEGKCRDGNSSFYRKCLEAIYIIHDSENYEKWRKYSKKHLLSSSRVLLKKLQTFLSGKFASFFE